MNISIHGSENPELKLQMFQFVVKDFTPFYYILKHTTIDLQTFLYLMKQAYDNEDILRVSNFKINLEYFALQMWIQYRNSQAIEHKEQLSTLVDPKSRYLTNLIASLEERQSTDP